MIPQVFADSAGTGGDIAWDQEPGSDPRAVRAAAMRLAARLRDYPIDGVVSWSEPMAIVAGFLIALELEVPLYRLVEFEGLVSFVGEPPNACSLALTFVRAPQASQVRAAEAVLQRSGGTPVVVGYLLHAARDATFPLGEDGPIEQGQPSRNLPNP